MAAADLDPSPIPLAVVWRRGSWICEYWKAPGVPGSLRLFRDGTQAMERRVRDVDDMFMVAGTWKELIEAEFLRDEGAPASTPHDSDRRGAPGERRRIPRGGRRRSDPRQ